MVSWRTTIVFLLLFTLAPGTLSQQARQQPVTLRESTYFDGEITFSTPAGPRTVSVTIKQFQVDSGAEVEM
ncbi:MAG TPA: hypothetical protein VE175_09640, partial [Woeseiaceae bacterium]|nr:hypothetical protein [Woeseiaceae bacterium]